MALNTSGPPLFGRALAAAGGTLAYWPLLLPLYVPSLLLGLVSAVPLYAAGQALASLGQWTEKIADGNAATVLMETSLAVAANGQTVGQDLPREVVGALASFGVAAWIVVLGVLLQGLVYNVLVGGVLEKLAGRTARPFWGACWRWTGPMLLFAAAGALIMLLLGGLGLALIIILPAGDLAGLLVKPLVAGLWLGCLNGLFELGRADMVVRDDRRALAALGRAFALLARPSLFLQALAIWIALVVLGAAYWVVVGVGIGAMPVNIPALGLFIGQVLALGGAMIKLVRLAVALTLAETARGAIGSG
ncbi:MAG: hypothetical protein ACYC3S_09720 [Chloroflexota bacterium]